MKARTKTPPARADRKRATPVEDGIASAQRVFAKVLEKADPKVKPVRR